MSPRIENMPEKKLVGQHMQMSLTKYKNNDPESEEEIWVPIRVKDLVT
ncbi:hypothetical protein [Dyadobacter sp. Leaf189]|nr:hypothetical protein [Dyadobacter sp. Leaf189]